MSTESPLHTTTIQQYASHEGALGPLFMRIAERLHVAHIFVALLTSADTGEQVLQGIAGLNIAHQTLERLTISLSAETEPLARVALTGATIVREAGTPSDNDHETLHALVRSHAWIAVPIPYVPDLPNLPNAPTEDLPAPHLTHSAPCGLEKRGSITSLPARGVLVAARSSSFKPEDSTTLELAAGQISAALLGLEAAQAEHMDELEERRIRQQLFESEKLAATGRLTASIAHEINNPLEAIKNALYLLVASSPPANPQREFLELAQRETERVSRIIRQMLGVARPSASMALTNINSVVREALALVEAQLRRRQIIPQLELDTNLPPIMASADQLKQVFLNLFLNARDAMPNGGGLLIQTRIAQRYDSVVLAEKHLVVRVRDDGEGIPEEIRARVFEPFFSTKGVRRGTGLGLWVCQEIIRSHGGQIHINSKVGKGTTFLVGLPLPVEQSAAPASPPGESVERSLR